MITKTTGITYVRYAESCTTHRIGIVYLRIIPGTAAVDRIVVEALTPGEVVLCVQAVPCALVVRNLHAVILRLSPVGGLNDITNIRERPCQGSERIARTAAEAGTTNGRCIQVLINEQ